MVYITYRMSWVLLFAILATTTGQATLILRRPKFIGFDKTSIEILMVLYRGLGSTRDG